MTNKYVVIGLLVIALVLGFVLGVLGSSTSARVGGPTIFNRLNLVGDLHSGLAGIKMIASGELVGPINLPSGNAATLAGTNTLSGATTISGTAHVSQSTSSTLQIGNTASGVGVGCLVLGDSGGATSTPVYITATGATVSATTTKPAICK